MKSNKTDRQFHIEGHRNEQPSTEQLGQAAQLLQRALALLTLAGRSPAPALTPPQDDRLLRLPEVQHLTGLGRSSIYAQMQKGTFPRSVKAGPRAATWSQAAVQAWIAARLDEGPTETGDLFKP